MNHFERRLWRWAWRTRVRMDRRRGDLLPAPFRRGRRMRMRKRATRCRFYVVRVNQTAAPALTLAIRNSQRSKVGCLVPKPGLISELRISSLS